MESDDRSDRQAIYQIRLRDTLDPSWSSWLSGMQIVPGDGITTITGPVADQAALRGILCALWDLNLDVISLTRLEDVMPDDMALLGGTL